MEDSIYGMEGTASRVYLGLRLQSILPRIMLGIQIEIFGPPGSAKRCVAAMEHVASRLAQSRLMPNSSEIQEFFSGDCEHDTMILAHFPIFYLLIH